MNFPGEKIVQSDTELLDNVIKSYVTGSGEKKGKRFTKKQTEVMASALKGKIVSEELIPLVSESQLRVEKKKIEQEAKAYKAKIFSRLRVTLIFETIFVAFLVGIVVNQATAGISWLSERLNWISWGSVIIALLVCILVVILGTSNTGE